MLQNKIYLNYLIQICKTFLIILFGLSIIALTVRAVNFLDLIVDSGYDVTTYFQYSILNLFGVTPKFIPLSFLLALIIFILKNKQNSEFVILWTSGVKKVYLVHLFFITSSLKFFELIAVCIFLNLFFMFIFFIFSLQIIIFELDVELRFFPNVISSEIFSPFFKPINLILTSPLG